MKAGIPMVICDGRREDVVNDAVAGKPVGTLFAGEKAAVKGRKLWLAYAGRRGAQSQSTMAQSAPYAWEAAACSQPASSM